jgi:hypothetical protein
MAADTGETMEGMINKLVIKALPLMGRFNRRAIPRPRRS